MFSSPSLVWNDSFPATCPATHSSYYPGNHPTLIPVDAKPAHVPQAAWLSPLLSDDRLPAPLHQDLVSHTWHLTSCFVFMFYPLSHWRLFPPSSGLLVLPASLIQVGLGSSHLGPRLLPPGASAQRGAATQLLGGLRVNIKASPQFAINRDFLNMTPFIFLALGLYIVYCFYNIRPWVIHIFLFYLLFHDRAHRIHFS